MTTPVVSRRAFLRGALGLAAGAGAATLPLVGGCARGAYPPAPGPLALFNAKQWTALHTASQRLLTAGPRRVSAVEVDVATAADHLLSRANPRIKGDVKQLLDMLEDATWLAFRFAPFSRLSGADQDAVLLSWQNSPFALQRQGFAALNKICATLFYMDARTWPQIGYPGPWVGRIDVGLGLDNQGPLAANPNPNIYARFPA